MKLVNINICQIANGFVVNVTTSEDEPGKPKYLPKFFSEFTDIVKYMRIVWPVAIPPASKIITPE
jgi:hypothetical protein